MVVLSPGPPKFTRMALCGGPGDECVNNSKKFWIVPFLGLFHPCPRVARQQDLHLVYRIDRALVHVAAGDRNPNAGDEQHTPTG